MSPNVIPAHVPPALVRDFDYVDMGSETDVYERYRKLHDGPDIFYTPSYGGHWVVTRYTDMDRVLFNAKDFSNRHSTIPPQPIQIPMAESDGAIHADYRRLVQPFFTPKAVDVLERSVMTLTDSLIDSFIDKGECEFASEFAFKMPIHITMNLLDLPLEDTPFMLKVAEGILHSEDPEVQAATYQKVFGYLAQKIIPARRAKPGTDMISAIVHGRVDNGRALDDMEILGLCCALIAGGLDTVANMLGFMALFLARNPEHRRQLIDEPALVGEAVEELVRRHALGNFTRVVLRDMDFNGLLFKAGDIVMTPTSLAGLDERRYPDALSVDFRREDKKHLAFGRGPHQCIGIVLARCELRVFLTRWLQRIPDFQLKAGECPVMASGKVNSVRYLPLTWSGA